MRLPPVATFQESRAATDELLGELRAGRWRPRAWARFIARSFERSAQQVRERPRAAVELTLLYGAFAALTGQPGRGWAAVSWTLAISHLGLLGPRRSLGLANALTLARANVPALGRATGSRLALPVLVSDLVDGWIARHRREGETAFGFYADPIADMTFWAWFAAREEPSTLARAGTLAVWAAPLAAVTVASFAGGRMTDAPRLVLVRPAAALQVLLVVRALRRRAATYHAGFFATSSV